MERHHDPKNVPEASAQGGEPHVEGDDERDEAGVRDDTEPPPHKIEGVAPFENTPSNEAEQSRLEEGSGNSCSDSSNHNA